LFSPGYLPASCPSSNATTEIATLYVQEHFARRGVGSALLAAAQREVKGRTGTAAVWLAVNAKNANAIAFYRQHGFIHSGG
jgi:diamine N-acetyltransferase